MSHSMSDRLSEWVSEWVSEGVEYCLWRPCRTQIQMSAGTHAQLACTNTPAQTYLLACACARTCTPPHTLTRTCTHTNSLYLTLIFVYMCMHCIHKDACVNVCVRTYIHLYADIYLYIYMYTCVRVYICAHTHICTWVTECSVRKRGSHIVSEREGTRVRACVRLDVRVMGRVCVNADIAFLESRNSTDSHKRSHIYSCMCAYM